MTHVKVFGFLASIVLLHQSLSQAVPHIQRQGTNQVALGPQVETTFRDLEQSDLGDITTIIIEAFSPSADWKYLMPEQAKYKDQLWYCLHKEVTHNWRKTNKTAAWGKVIAVPVSDAASERRDHVVAFGVWVVREREKISASQNNSLFDVNHIIRTKCDPLPGVNMTRAEDFNRQDNKIWQKYFNEPYEKYLSLNLLATHPEWDGNGFGARHVHWGMELTRELDLPLTLFATPAGWPLYDSLGFESLKNATYTLLDGLGTVWHEVMRWNY